jgi:alkanesulfonate monooxygenase SsuD/methylene tetrahydromethanopterin reductase-like flavin-dependent oxidoreductase (luciferase family)
MLDHITGGRFEFGTGRGAGSHEVATFNGLTTDATKAMWDEVAHEIPRMWEQRDYEHHGEFFSVPTPHNILPKPYGHGHPPIWVACGNPGTFAKAGAHGIGAIAFNFEPIHNLKGRVEAYKEAIENVTDQIGQFKNDNVMMTNACICLKDRDRAREIAKKRTGYRVTMVNMYHDTMPKSPDAVVWPNPPRKVEWTDEILDLAIAGGYMLCGTPEEVCEQLEAYRAVGCDQVVFGVPDEGYTHDETLEMIEVFGNEVIPEFDRDPVHSTTRYRQTAQRRYSDYNHPLPEGLDAVEVPQFPVSV